MCMCIHVCVYIYIYIHTISRVRSVFNRSCSELLSSGPWGFEFVHAYGRFPKFHRVFWGRDPGTLKSDIVSKKHPQLICSEFRLSN